MSLLSKWRVSLLCAVAAAALSACGDDVDIVEPTPNAANRSSYPCELLTKAMAQDLLGIQSLRRVGAQSFDDGTEHCQWARGRYKMVPSLRLVLSSTRSPYGRGRSLAAVQREYERAFKGKPVPGYRALRGLGDGAFLISQGRISSEVLVEQDGRSFVLRMDLKQNPRSEKPPLAALEALARDISARYTRPPG